jgi:hypothetical protein
MRETQAEFDRRDTTDTVIKYGAANGHLMEYYEDANQPGKPARACAWASWHSDDCTCGGEPIPDW